MQIFKTKTFARWMRKEGLSDAGLIIAVAEMEEGKIDANLGGKVFKKRVAFPGRGKRGSARTLIAYQDSKKAFFMFGFSKNERASIDVVELKALKLMAKILIEKSNVKLKKDLDTKILIEVNTDGYQDS
jgi:hypothetical protein